jgi:methionyl-tRNA synthetase
MDYLSEVSAQFGISLWLLVIIIVWSVFWKLLALWKSARKSQPVWFVLLFIVNTIGILEILYIYVFSEIRINRTAKESPEKKSKKKSKK